jgi:uncharacterized membrane protein YukC
MFLKPLAVGFVVVLSLAIVTFVYGYFQAAPKEKATSFAAESSSSINKCRTLDPSDSVCK